MLAGARWTEWRLVFASAKGTALNGSNITHRFQRALEDAGIRKVRFHDLRHSAALFLLAKGLPMRLVQDQLGHSGLSHTIQLYAHISSKQKSEAAQVMDSLKLRSESA